MLLACRLPLYLRTVPVETGVLLVPTLYNKIALQSAHSGKIP